MHIIKRNIESKNKVMVIDEDEDDDETKHLPKTNGICSKCGNGEAYWFMRQTRSADEPPTVFYTCTKCEHKWRSYG